MDREDAKATGIRNRVFKDRERARRDARMLAHIRKAQPPFAPVVLSWLSRQLDKPAGKITPQDVQSLVT